MRKPTLLACALLPVVACALLASAARAQDPANVREAKMRFQEGLTLHDQGHDEEARLKFLEAYAVLKSPNLLFNLARSEQLSGHDVDAMTHYEAYVHSPDPKVADSDRADARQHMTELLPRVGQIAVTAAAGAHVSVDGRATGQDAPLADPVPVAAGKHTVSAQTADGVVRSLDVVAALGVVVTADFTQAETPAPSATTSAPATSPAATEPPLAPQPNDVGPVTSATAPFWTPTRTAGVVVAGVGVVSLVTGFVFAAQASSDSDRAASILAGLGQSSCAGGSTQPSCLDLQSAHDDQSRDHALNLVFVGVGAAAVVAGAVLFFWPRPAHAKATATLVPMASPHSGGLELRGIF
jgi:hypothetical protein